jgi:hypothetical protein
LVLCRFCNFRFLLPSLANNGSNQRTPVHAGRKRILTAGSASIGSSAIPANEQLNDSIKEEDNVPRVPFSRMNSSKKKRKTTIGGFGAKVGLFSIKLSFDAVA